MSLAARAYTLLTARVLDRASKAALDPAATQARVLRGLLRRGASTQWGRRFGLRDIRTPEEFRRRVPVTGYEDARLWWHRAFDGERNVTWPGHVRYFALSSGTTSGNKLIPMTRDAIRSNIRSGAILAAVLARRGSAESLVRGKFLYLGGCTTLRPQGRSLVGDGSGIMNRHVPFFARSHRLPRPDVAGLTNWEEKIARMARDYRAEDVRVLVSLPSWAAILFKELRAAAASSAAGAGPAAIGAIWPNLTYFVSYGIAFEPYRTAMEEYIGRPVHYVDTYSSSEAGMVAIQEEPGGPMGLIVDNGVFFEFVEAARADEADAPRLHIGEVRTGVDYAVLLTTNAGLWACPQGDVVRFESLRPPRITFVGRTQVMLSAFGEHLTLELIEKAVAEACRSAAALVADYTVAPVYPSPAHPKPGHRWIVEFDRPPSDPAAFMAAIDAALRKESEDYDTHRTGDYGMPPPELVPVAPRTFYHWMKSKGKLGGQHKVPRVVRSDQTEEELLRISRSLEGRGGPQE